MFLPSLAHLKRIPVQGRGLASHPARAKDQIPISNLVSVEAMVRNVKLRMDALPGPLPSCGLWMSSSQSSVFLLENGISSI